MPDTTYVPAPHFRPTAAIAAAIILGLGAWPVSSGAQTSSGDEPAGLAAPRTKPASATDTAGLTEWTSVSVSLGKLPNDEKARGVAFFVSQRRLVEVGGGPEALTLLARRAESSAVVAQSGDLSLTLPPGNYILVWDPNAQVDDSGTINSPAAGGTAATEGLGRIGKPGPDSLLATPEDDSRRAERAKARREAFAAALQTGKPPVVENRLNLDGLEKPPALPVYVVFNRYVRPPAVEFVDWSATDPASKGRIEIRLVDEKGQPYLDGGVRLRGNNGDLVEPLPTLSGTKPKPGTFLFRDVHPQPYQALLQFLPPPPPAGTAPGTLAGLKDKKPTDRPANLVIREPDLLFDGDPISLELTVAAKTDNK